MEITRYKRCNKKTTLRLILVTQLNPVKSYPYLAISRTFLKKSEKVRLIKIMNEKAQTETFESDKTFKHSNIRIKRSILADGTHQHQIGATK